MTILDPRSAKAIATLHPVVQDLAKKFLVAGQTYLDTHAPGLVIRAISGYRTYAEQNALYAKGRTAPGPKVTNARGGYSNHNFGLSFDIGLFRGSDYLEDSPMYDALGGVGKAVGLAWGGDWKSIKDTPHYELPHGLSLATLRARCDANGKPIGDILAGTPYAFSTHTEIAKQEAAAALNMVPVDISGKRTTIRAFVESGNSWISARDAAVPLGYEITNTDPLTLARGEVSQTFANKLVAGSRYVDASDLASWTGKSLTYTDGVLKIS